MLHILTILLIFLIIITLYYILLNKKEKFTNVYSDVLDYIDKNIEKKIEKTRNNNLCFNNDDMLINITGDKTNTCDNYYNKIKNINYKVNPNKYKDNKYIYDANEPDKLYDNITKKSYSFSELCPETTGDVEPLYCIKKYNNDINDINYKLNKLINNTSLNMDSSLNNIDNELINYRNDKYRLYNTENIKNFLDTL